MVSGPADVFVRDPPLGRLQDSCRIASTQYHEKCCGFIWPWAILGMELPQSKQCWDAPRNSPRCLQNHWDKVLTPPLPLQALRHFHHHHQRDRSLLALPPGRLRPPTTVASTKMRIGIGTTMQPIDGWINPRMDVCVCVL